MATKVADEEKGDKLVTAQQAKESLPAGPPYEYYNGKDAQPLKELQADQKEQRQSRWGAPRQSRWGPPVMEDERNEKMAPKSFTPICVSYLPIHSKSLHEIEVLIRKHRIDDLTKRLILHDFEQENDADLRSPSPRPVYDTKTGLRTNTRDVRLKDKYWRERQRLILEVLALEPSYKPPADFKPPKKYKKIFIPDTSNDDVFINYIGQIIGPGGQTQKRLEKETKCRIKIRGKGSQKDTSKNYERELLDGPEAAGLDEEEPLHVHLTADTEDQLEHAATMINSILQQTEEAKKFALILHDGTGVKRVFCENCGSRGHKFHECPEKIMSTKSKIRCKYCHSNSHPSTDCPTKQKEKNLLKALTNGEKAADPKSYEQIRIETRANQLLSAEDEL